MMVAPAPAPWSVRYLPGWAGRPRPTSARTPIVLFHSLIPQAVWPASVDPATAVVVHVQDPTGIMTVSPSTANPMAARTSSCEQLMAVLVVANVGEAIRRTTRASSARIIGRSPDADRWTLPR